MKRSIAFAALLLCLALMPSAAFAQKSDAGQDKSKQEIEALRSELKAVQSDLQEIKALLLSMQAPNPLQSFSLTIDKSPVQGSDKARVVIFEFSDYQCPYCGFFARDTMPQIERDFITTGKARFVFRNLPLTDIHPNAFKAAVAAGCAADQGKYWEMHDHLFKNQNALDPKSLSAAAQSLGLDEAKFNTCLAADTPGESINKDKAEAIRLGIRGTPYYLIGMVNPKDLNDPNIRIVRLINGTVPYVVFKAAIDNVLAGQ